MESPALLSTANKAGEYHTSSDLQKMRLNFCRDVVKGKCSDNDCPIYRKYYDTGLSCNGALDKYPDECRELMRANFVMSGKKAE